MKRTVIHFPKHRNWCQAACGLRNPNPVRVSDQPERVTCKGCRAHMGFK